METYQIKKEEALNKLNSFLTLSCLYNMIPEYSEEVDLIEIFIFEKFNNTFI